MPPRSTANDNLREELEACKREERQQWPKRARDAVAFAEVVLASMRGELQRKDERIRELEVELEQTRNPKKRDKTK